jgi:MinD superfamily P-loop ATPase
VYAGEFELQMMFMIEQFCREGGVEIAGKVPFDVSITKAM